MEKLTYLERLARYGINGAHPGGLKLTQFLLANEVIDATTVLMDVGCGTGQTAAYIGTHFPCKIVAVDINPKMLAKARRKFARNHLDILVLQANAMELPFPKNSFNIILSESVIVFTEIRRTLREFSRTLKPGGILLAIEVTALHPFTAAEISDIHSVLGISFLPTQDEWCKMFKTAGFSTVDVLLQEPLQATGFASPFINWVFWDYRSILLRYNGKLHYGVYRCRK